MEVLRWNVEMILGRKVKSDQSGESNLPRPPLCYQDSSRTFVLEFCDNSQKKGNIGGKVGKLPLPKQEEAVP